MSPAIQLWLSTLAPLCGLTANAMAQIAFQRSFRRLPIVFSYVFGLTTNLAITVVGVTLFLDSANWPDYTIALCTAGCLSFCYSNAVNLVYSSLRVRMLLWMNKQGGSVGVVQLNALCDGKAVVADRLSRMEHWGQLRQDGEKYFLTPGWMFFLAQLFQWIKLIYFKKGFSVISSES